MATDTQFSDIETIEVLINDQYGGWRLSKKALDMFNARNTELNSEFKHFTSTFGDIPPA